MARKIPGDAFSFYLSLGTTRSYEAVAAKFGVSKRAVTDLARREDWQTRLVQIEREARQRSDEKAVETLEVMNERHLKTLRVIQGKALQVLQQMPLTRAMDAIRALTLAIREERGIRGVPSEQPAVDIEEIMRRERELWLVPAEEERGG